MKALILLFALFSLVSYAGTPVETLVPVDGVYSPNGFDSNDNSEIIVEGWLPNLCHKTPMTKSEIKNGKIHITVTALRYDESSPFCPEMIVPFIQSVNVGILDKGIYEIVVNGKSPYQKNSKIKISESSSNALDDHIYANVHYVEKSHGTKTVTLVKFVSNEVNTYSVLPIMKRVRDFCPMKMTPFAYDVEVPQSLNVNKVLLHVRGMDGNSVNSILHLEQ
jgi:hypothetical protein